MSNRVSLASSFSALLALAATSALSAACTAAGGDPTGFVPATTNDAGGTPEADPPLQESAPPDDQNASQDGSDTPDAGCTLDSQCDDGNP